MDATAVGGIALVVAALCFFVGAANPALIEVWTAGEKAQLRLIDLHRQAWRVTNVLFGVATVGTVAGLSVVPGTIGAGGSPLAQAAVTAYLLAAAAWLLSIVFRLAVTPHAAARFVSTGVLDPMVGLVGRWSTGLFAAFTITAGCSLVGLGAAVLLGAALPGLLGWFMVAIGAVIAGGYLIAGDMPPFVAYLPTGALGLALLLGRS